MLLVDRRREERVEAREAAIDSIAALRSEVLDDTKALARTERRRWRDDHARFDYSVQVGAAPASWMHTELAPCSALQSKSW